MVNLISDIKIPEHPGSSHSYLWKVCILPLRLLQLPFQILFGHLLTYVVMPAKMLHPFSESRTLANQYFVVNARGDKLQTVTLYPSATAQEEASSSPLKVKHCLYFTGNGSDISKKAHQIHSELFSNLSIPVTFFNYGGVAQSLRKNTLLRFFSSPPKFDDWVDDGINQVFALLATQPTLKLNEIELYGHSIGGGIASAVAVRLAHYCSHPSEVPESINGVNLRNRFASGQEPYLFNERSFSSLSNVVTGQLIGSTGIKRSPLNWLLFGIRAILVLPVILLTHVVLFLTRLETYAGAGFASYPLEKKNYAVVRSPKELRGHETLHIPTTTDLLPLPVNLSRYPQLKRWVDKNSKHYVKELDYTGKEPHAGVKIAMEDDEVITSYGSLHKNNAIKRQESKEQRKKHFFTPFNDAPEHKLIPGNDHYHHTVRGSTLENRDGHSLPHYHRAWLCKAG